MPDLIQTFNAAKDSAAAYTSGVDALPGGLGAMANVIDNAKGAVNAIPGLSKVAGALSSLPGIGSIPGAGALTGALGALSGAAGALGSLSSLASKGLSALAGLGLSAKDSTLLNAAMAGLTSGGSIPMALPAVASNTFTAGSKAMEAGLLGSTLLAGFSHAGNGATFGVTASTSAYEKQLADTKALIAKRSAISDETLALTQKFKESKATLLDAQNNYPQGDPHIAAVMAERDSLLTQISAKMAEFDKLT